MELTTFSFPGEIVSRNSINGGVQYVVRFSNNYGASIVNHAGSYGTELAVIVFNGDDWNITYSTPITDDVLGWLNESELIDALRSISEL